MKWALSKLKNKTVYSAVVILSTVLFTSCSQATNSLNINDTVTSTSQNYTSSSLSKDEPSYVTPGFKSELAKQNISFSDKEYTQMRDMVRVKPAGEWTPGPENDSKANLNKHFLKHGHDFKPPFTTEKDYFNAAMKFGAASCDTCNYYLDTSSYKDEKIISIVKWNSKSYEFTVLRANGQTATYFIDTKLKSGRFILIPQEMR